jgi:prevent-host-death family protein
MALRVLNTNEARLKWRDVVDAASSGETDTVIERYGKPLVAVIPFEDYEALEEALDDLRATRRAERALAEWKADPSTARDFSEIRAEMVKEGLLSE